MLNMTVLQFILRSKSRVMAQVVLNMLSGSSSRVGVANKEVFDDSYIFVGAGMTENGDAITGPLQHGENMCSPSVKMTIHSITPQALIDQSHGLAILFSNLDEVCVSSASQSMAIIAGRSNEDISDDALAEIKSRMHDQRSKNSTKAFETCCEKETGIPGYCQAKVKEATGKVVLCQDSSICMG